MREELYFNGIDVFDEYGVVMGNGCYAALVCPASAKEYVTSESRLEHGKRYMTDFTKMAERTLALQLYIKAYSRDDFYRKLTRLAAEVFEKGAIAIKTKYQPSLVYNCIYKSCSQLSEYNGKAGKFVLNVVEPDPSNRS